MAKVKVLGGDFDKIDADFAADQTFVFHREDGKRPNIVKPGEVARTYYADQGAMGHADVPAQLVAAFNKEHPDGSRADNMEVVIVLRDGRWAYLRADHTRTAKAIHNICPDDRPSPQSSDRDDPDRVGS
jgi:hypothetical protein